MTFAQEYGPSPAWMSHIADAEPANDAVPLPLPMQTLDLAALSTKRAEPKRFVIEGIAPAGEVTLLTGPGSAGKSLLAQQLATAAAAGIRCLGLEIEAAPAIYLTCEEDAGQLHWRQEHICDALGVPMADLAGKLHLISRRGQTDNEIIIAPGGSSADGFHYPAEPGAAYRRIAQMVARTGSRLVFLDNVAHLFPGNENDRGEVTRFCNLLNRLAGETGAAIMLIGHPNKSGDSYSGSTAWLNAVRSQVFLDRERDAEGAVLDPDARVLSVGKANYARNGEVLRFRWHNLAYVLEDDLPPDTAAEIAETIRASGDNEIFLRCLRTRNGQERPVSESPSSRTYAPRVFEKMAEAKGLRMPRLEAAMERLFTIGRIERGVVCKVGRKDREGLLERCADVRADPALTGCADVRPVSAPSAPAHTPYTTYREGAGPTGAPAPSCSRCDGEGCEWCER